MMLISYKQKKNDFWIIADGLAEQLQDALQGYNNIMQIKQLKSIVNAHYFTPWNNDTDTDLPNSSQKDSYELPKFKKYAEVVKEKQSMQEEAKKTLLNIDDEFRKKKVSELKFQVRRKKPSMESIFPQGIDQLKLPPINGLVDFSNCYILENQIKPSNLSSIDDSFRKLGEFKAKPKPSVGRSLSDVSPISKQLFQINDLRRKFQTIDVLSQMKRGNSEMRRGNSEMKSLKLKGKKFSLDAREQSERTLQIDRGSYLPTHPNITPHQLLFGHRQDDVLRKVLHQLNFRVK